jgi:signal peptidase II
MRPAGSSATPFSGNPSSGNPSSGDFTTGSRLPFNRFLLFFVPLLLGAAADLLTKGYVFEHYFPVEFPFDHSPRWWVEGIFGIQTSTNAGALFGIGQGYSWLFASLSIVVLLAILAWLFLFKGAWDRWLTLALGLIGGGIIGNLVDRVGWGYDPSHPIEIKYHVRDWLHFNLEGVPGFNPWPNFNIADALLVTGAIMLFLHAFLFAASSETASAGGKEEWSR